MGTRFQHTLSHTWKHLSLFLEWISTLHLVISFNYPLRYRVGDATLAKIHSSALRKRSQGWMCLLIVSSVNWMNSSGFMAVHTSNETKKYVQRTVVWTIDSRWSNCVTHSEANKGAIRYENQRITDEPVRRESIVEWPLFCVDLY